MVALGLFALCTAFSMAALSTGLGFTLSRGRVAGIFPRIAPASVRDQLRALLMTTGEREEARALSPRGPHGAAPAGRYFR